MKTALILLIAFLIAGCAGPSMEMQRLSEMCAAGDGNACANHEQLAQQRKAALAGALYQSGGALKQMGQPTYRQPMGIITCQRMGVFTNCHY